VGNDPFITYDVFVINADERPSLVLHLGEGFLSEDVLDASLSLAECEQSTSSVIAVRLRAIFDAHARQFCALIRKTPQDVQSTILCKAKKIADGYIESTVKVLSCLRCSPEDWSVIKEPVVKGLAREDLASAELFIRRQVFADQFWRSIVSGDNLRDSWADFLGAKDLPVYEAAALSMLKAVQRPEKKLVKAAAENLTSAITLAAVDETPNIDIASGRNADLGIFNDPRLDSVIGDIIARADEGSGEGRRNEGSNGASNESCDAERR